MQTITDKVITLDIQNLSAEDLKWLHDLKNKACAMTGRLQLKDLQRELQEAI